MAGMSAREFDEILNLQIQRVINMLGSKAGEYASDKDRLHTFRQAAALQGITPRQALVGLMSKHTVSIYDMARSDKDFTMEVWDEKITDHINYLILLRALAYEEDRVDRALGTNGTD